MIIITYYRCTTTLQLCNWEIFWEHDHWDTTILDCDNVWDYSGDNWDR